MTQDSLPAPHARARRSAFLVRTDHEGKSGDTDNRAHISATTVRLRDIPTISAKGHSPGVGAFRAYIPARLRPWQGTALNRTRARACFGNPISRPHAWTPRELRIVPRIRITIDIILSAGVSHALTFGR